ncbi:NADP oxidoreductase coenzyme f420-dependent [Nostocoides japonicum T1-X7]|uniref:NADP oxidoreductase coenzyme f420-dependent n=1 Tax=Nostocoides japonicum T1-X7 TaxID=1194083 RepID=A0A077LXQ1_9MICO|nr:pyrroline-5-carboxylate reductase [Tetrasphaera japonica]CCH78476.1 NADP oxidoreductase coenzyme f420-dependent [Tetrasphaera japonica T1-X7]
MRIGFVGTGVIAKAIVVGLIRSGSTPAQITLSPRNAETAAELAALDERIHVSASNQEVLTASDVVCLAVRPQIVTQVLSDLEFEPRHHVISFVPGLSIEMLHALAGPVERVVRAIPLPAVADGTGCTAIHPADEVAASIFSALGTAVEVGEEAQYEALQAVTATMASFYAVLEHQARWLVRHGLPYADARAFLSGYAIGLANETARTGQTFTEMIDYLMTPGGLNEQVHGELTESGAYDHYDGVLDRVLARVTSTQETS